LWAFGFTCTFPRQSCNPLLPLSLFFPPRCFDLSAGPGPQGLTLPVRQHRLERPCTLFFLTTRLYCFTSPLSARLFLRLSLRSSRTLFSTLRIPFLGIPHLPFPPLPSTTLFSLLSGPDPLRCGQFKVPLHRTPITFFFFPYR